MVKGINVLERKKVFYYFFYQKKKNFFVLFIWKKKFSYLCLRFRYVWSVGVYCVFVQVLEVSSNISFVCVCVFHFFIHNWLIKSIFYNPFISLFLSLALCVCSVRQVESLEQKVLPKVRRVTRTKKVLPKKMILTYKFCWNFKFNLLEKLLQQFELIVGDRCTQSVSTLPDSQINLLLISLNLVGWWCESNFGNCTCSLDREDTILV